MSGNDLAVSKIVVHVKSCQKCQNLLLPRFSLNPWYTLYNQLHLVNHPVVLNLWGWWRLVKLADIYLHNRQQQLLQLTQNHQLLLFCCCCQTFFLPALKNKNFSLLHKTSCCFIHWDTIFTFFSCLDLLLLWKNNTFQLLSLFFHFCWKQTKYFCSRIRKVSKNVLPRRHMLDVTTRLHRRHRWSLKSKTSASAS